MAPPRWSRYLPDHRLRKPYTGGYCRYPLSYRDVRDMLAERGIVVDAATVYRWVQKFGPEIRKRAYGRHRSWRGLTWHVDETYLRVAVAKVVGDNGRFPERRTVPRVMDTAIRTLHADHGCRLFVLSLGDTNANLPQGRVGPWAATLDALARELDVLIVVSAGNRGRPRPDLPPKNRAIHSESLFL